MIEAEYFEGRGVDEPPSDGGRYWLRLAVITALVACFLRGVKLVLERL